MKRTIHSHLAFTSNFMPSLLLRKTMPTTQTVGNRALDNVERRPRLHEQSRNRQRVHPLSINKNCSNVILSCKDVSVDCSGFGWSMRRVSASVSGIFSSCMKETSAGHAEAKRVKSGDSRYLEAREDVVDVKSLKRCSWITKSSAEVYVSFHDEYWGVPVFRDSQLFELLGLSGMLIDLSWTEILTRRELYRKVFANFDHNIVAKMDEKAVLKMSHNKILKLTVSRIRCIVDNAKCMQQVAKEFGSFSGYIWSHVNHRPIINKHRQLSRKSIPLKTPKSEAISKDLVMRGFRLVSPVTVYAFMQAAGMAIDHDVECFRFRECIKLAERSWGMTSLGK